VAELTGRELDEACARAIWHGGDLAHAEHPAHGRSYSTDPATLDEKLAWLRETRDDGSTEVHDVTLSMDEGGFYARKQDGECIVRAYSAYSLHEATARLVVAVAAKEPKP
jgi:hypothetical protein